MKTQLLLIINLSLFLFACGEKNIITKTSNWDPSKYSVQNGDTLYSIAWRYDLDFKQLAKWNKIRSPYLIRPGQRLIMTAPLIKNTDKYYLFGGNAPQKKQTFEKRKPVIDYSISKNIPPAPPLTNSSSISSKYKQPLPKYNQNKSKITSNTNQTQNVNTFKSPSNGAINWMWPINGKVINRFAANKNDRKGIDIKGKANQKVLAASNGVVVYSGSGLVSYGNLIIIKHSERFLSAYAFNKKLLVKEGVHVKKGQSIAIIGKKQTVTNLLHFEIRKDGKPVNPLVYLP